jgi:CheY-like chemotaxis protein
MSETPSTQKFFAVIVEDEADLADIFSEAMKAAGFRTEILSSGEQALQRLQEVVPAIILLDLHLPGMDGGRLLREIRKDARLANTRVIVTTADHNMTLNLPSKPDLVLLKPISFSQLRDLAARLMQIRPRP